jgi:hypothetical protein
MNGNQAVQICNSSSPTRRMTTHPPPSPTPCAPTSVQNVQISGKCPNLFIKIPFFVSYILFFVASSALFPR